MSWQIIFTKQAVKDVKKIANANLKSKVQNLLQLLSENPFHKSPPYEKLVGDLAGAYSRRINIQHRLIYQILEKEKTIKILRMWTQYE